MEILNTYSTFDEVLNILSLFGFCGSVVLILFALGNLLFKIWKDALKCIILAMCVFILSVGFGKWGISTETIYHEVIITDYNKIDFDKYEIDSRKGKITVLKELK